MGYVKAHARGDDVVIVVSYIVIHPAVSTSICFYPRNPTSSSIYSALSASFASCSAFASANEFFFAADTFGMIESGDCSFSSYLLSR